VGFSFYKIFSLKDYNTISWLAFVLKSSIMLDIVQRYIPVVNAIKRARLKTKKIVEVGGTGEGVAFYLPDYEIIDCDIQFVKNILHNVTPIKNKGGRLPLPDNYVDILISVDMLEHLPIKKNREKMVKEMLRVAKSKVILTIPTGEKSLEAVRKFGELFHKKYPKIKNKYVIEHLTYGHPEKEEVINMIKNGGFKTIIHTQKNTNTTLWLLFQKFYIKFPKLYLIFRYRKFWYHILKPFSFLFNFGKTMRTIFYIELDKKITT